MGCANSGGNATPAKSSSSNKKAGKYSSKDQEDDAADKNCEGAAGAAGAAGGNSHLGKYAAPKVNFQHLIPLSHGSHVPKARKAHSICCVDEHSIFMFGGLVTSDDKVTDHKVMKQSKDKPAVSGQIYHYTPRDKTWHHPTIGGQVPTPRATHVSAGYDGNIYTIGCHNQKDPLLYRYIAAFARWVVVETAGDSPPPMAGGSAVVAGDLLLVFGGDTGSTVTAELWAFEFLTSKWNLVEDTRNDIVVQGRRDHSAVVFEDKMLVFGGFGVVSDQLQFVQFSASTKSWSLVPIATDEGTVPEKRGGHCCSLYHHYMFIFGGMHHKKFLHDMHIFNVLSGVWTKVILDGPSRATLPSRRGFGVSAVCGHYWYIHGGIDDEVLYRDFVAVDCNELCKVADPGYVPPTITGETKDAEGNKIKLKPGDDGYNKHNMKIHSPLWNDMVARASKPMIGMS